MTDGFNPDYSVPPGETLRECLDHERMTVTDLSEKIGYSVQTINGILEGKFAINPNFATKLAEVFGVPTNFWIERQKKHEAILRGQKFS